MKKPSKRPAAKAIERDFLITNKLGLHARPAALFVQTANHYDAQIEVFKDDLQADGKSIMGIMTLAAEVGSSIKIRATGKDAGQAIDALAKLIESNFGE